MKREEGARITRVLAFGLDANQLKLWRDAVEDGLWGMHGDWVLFADSCTTVEHAVAYIKNHKDLEVLLFDVDDADTEDDDIHERLFLDAKKIAEALASHPFKPWVILTESADDFELKSVFEESGIEVRRQGYPPFIISNRWYEQNGVEKAV